MTGLDVRVVRGAEDVAASRELWDGAPWTRELAEHPYFVSPNGSGAESPPFAVFVRRDSRVAAAAAGRFETKRIPVALGYRPLHKPLLRVLQLTAGGVVATEDEAAAVLARTLASVLEAGEADVLAVPAMPTASPAYAELAALGGPLERQRFVPAWTRQRLVVPESFDAFLASRSKKIRFGIRYDGKKLEQALGEVSVGIYDRPEQLDTLVRDVDAVARLTYQRALGMGFVAGESERQQTALALEHGWVRAYVLYHGDRPVAYWLCSLHRGTLMLRTTGYDPSYAEHRPGIYLLMRLIDHACGDPAVQVVDFGPGRSSYKRHFSSETYEERNLLVFAPTLRGRQVNAIRTAVLGTGRLARWALDRAGVTDRLKKAWRQRLRAGRQGA